MPTGYAEDTYWNARIYDRNGYFTDYLRFDSNRPYNGRRGVGRIEGVVGGNTLEEIQDEANVWLSLYPDKVEAYLSAERTVKLYNRDTGESHDLPLAPPAPPYTPDELARKKHMVKVSLLREAGKTYLQVDAKGLHDTLDSIGCRLDTTGTKYQDRPHAGTAIADVSSNQVSTEVFLQKGTLPTGEYGVRYDLSTVYTRPPSMDSLRKLVQSCGAKVRTILEHYQPIDIQVNIQKKVIIDANRGEK